MTHYKIGASIPRLKEAHPSQMERRQMTAGKIGRNKPISERSFKRRILLTPLILILLLSISVLPISTRAMSANPIAADGKRATPLATGLPDAATVTVTFLASADATVREANPSTNYGTDTVLQVNGASNPEVESYILFSVIGMLAPIQSATLRIYDTNNATTDGPAVYATATGWAELGITWNTRPARTSGETDNAAVIATNTWVDYDVIPLVTGNGNYSFALVADSSDGAAFSSREGTRPPQLVITTDVGPTATTGPSPTKTPTPIASPTNSPTPGASPTPGSSAIQHVFVIVMENHSYSQVWNTNSTPYITQLGKSYARATNYHALTYPSLPNYLQMYAGSNYGITNDCKPSSTCHINAINLADNLEAKGLTWKGYMESMPAPCALNGSGDYAVRHNPFIYFDNIRNNSTRCKNHVVAYTALAVDLATRQTTSNYAMIVPNVCNDTHDCSITVGDNWLKNNIPAILNSPACTVDKCLLILTWDEDDGSHNNQVLTIFAGSAAKTGGVTSSVSYTHYSLLRTIEDIFGLPTQTANDAAASPMNDLLR